MKNKSINRKFSNSSLRQSKNKMKGGSFFFKKTHFNIPAGTTEITDKSWNEWKVDKTKLKSVTIPDSVETIGEQAFSRCTSLTKVTIPKNVETIGESAFNRCTKLVKVTIQPGVTEISMNSFSNCTSLNNVTIPPGVTEISMNSFSGCTSLTNVTIPDSVEIIGNSAFYSCSSLTEITIPKDVTIIGEAAFSKCSSLVKINIPDSVETIGFAAFFKCASLVKINIPDSVETIGYYAFADCSSLETIDFDMVTDLERPNKFLEFNSIERTAIVKETIDDSNSCLIKKIWPANNTEPNEEIELVDGSGITSPIILAELSGYVYEVYDCWAKDRPTDDFKKLAIISAKQNIQKLRNELVLIDIDKKNTLSLKETKKKNAKHDIEEAIKKEKQLSKGDWTFQLPYNKNYVPNVKEIDLTEVLKRLINNDINLDQPWQLVWNDENNDRLNINDNWFSKTGKKPKKRKHKLGIVSGKKEKDNKKKQSNRKRKEKALLGRRATGKKKGKPSSSSSKKRGRKGSKSRK